MLDFKKDVNQKAQKVITNVIPDSMEELDSLLKVNFLKLFFHHF